MVHSYLHCNGIVLPLDKVLLSEAIAAELNDSDRVAFFVKCLPGSVIALWDFKHEGVLLECGEVIVRSVKQFLFDRIPINLGECSFDHLSVYIKFIIRPIIKMKDRICYK